MDNNIKKKGMLIAITIIMIGLLISGGTYALLTQQVAVTNGNYVTNTHCFNVTYANDNTSVNETLFPSGDALGGINDYVSATADATCGLNGKGTLKMHIDSGTSNVLTGTVAAHCENENTLETISEYTTQGACTAVTGNKWVTDGTALKYAVFIGNDLYNSDYIKTANIGNDIVIHDNFSVTSTTKKIEVYVWLDGFLTGDTYYDLPFNSSIHLETSQAKSTTTYSGDTPLLTGYLLQLLNRLDDSDSRLYQRIEYLKSTGAQYINTNLPITTDLKLTLDFKANSNTSGKYIMGRYQSNDGSFYLYFGSGYFQTAYGSTYANTTKQSNTDRHYWEFYIENGNSIVKCDSDVVFTRSTLATMPNSNILIGGTYHSSSAVGNNIYGAKLYKDNLLIRNFVPCKRITDGKPGLYDTVNGVFYTNAATSGNDFTPGPDV